jgi:hypothetical protein
VCGRILLLAALGLLPGWLPARADNPVFPGWHADPDASVFAGHHWIFPTASARCEARTRFDAFSPPDLAPAAGDAQGTKRP